MNSPPPRSPRLVRSRETRCSPAAPETERIIQPGGFPASLRQRAQPFRSESSPPVVIDARGRYTAGMSRVFLFHWNEAEARERAARLERMGHAVRTEASDGARGGSAVLADPPDAVVVDLSRLPSHGRVTAQAIRSHKAGRQLPIVFLLGDPAKMDKVRQAVPDGIFWATWETLEATLAGLGAGTAAPSGRVAPKPAETAEMQSLLRATAIERRTAVRRASATRAAPRGAAPGRAGGTGRSRKAARPGR